MDVRTALAAFDAWCAEHRAANTRLLWRSRLRSLDAQLGDRELSTLSRVDLEHWLSVAAHRPDGSLLAPDTRRATAIAFDRFQKWCTERTLLAKLILERIEKPAGRLRERIPTEAETARLLAAASPEFRLIYQALRRSGARPNELCRAQIANWDRTRRAIILTQHKTAEKTGRPRRIAVGDKLAPLLIAAIAGRAAGPIFLSPSGRPWRAQRLSAVYRQLRDAAGLPKDLVLYLARHEHGTKICKTLGIHAAKELLGHTDIKTTQRYVHATDDERAVSQDSFD